MPFARVLLIALLAVATATDILRQKIYNSVTYTGLIAGLVCATFDGGTEQLLDHALAVLICGGIMIFAFLAMGVGGGDVKLVAMMSAFLGVRRGIEAMLWTFVIGAAMAIAILIWRLGFVHIIKKTGEHLKFVFSSKGWVPLTEDEREPLQHGLFLAPSALIAVCVLFANEHYRWF